ncbi:hypothetical protein EMCRGX_G016300 [Ephydatia muelleri]
MYHRDNWKGFLRVGLTSCVPDNIPVVPSLSSLLPKHSWIVNGSTVTENGATLTQTYGAALCAQVEDIVGVQLESDFTMHMFLNGEDLGIAATITTISQGNHGAPTGDPWCTHRGTMVHPQGTHGAPTGPTGEPWCTHRGTMVHPQGNHGAPTGEPWRLSQSHSGEWKRFKD